MAFKLVLLLVACLLVLTGFADENVGNLDAFHVGLPVEGPVNYYEVDEARAMEGPVLARRAEATATVTITETVCGPVGSTYTGEPPIFSIPETTLVTDTDTSGPVPTTVQSPASSQSSGADGVTSVAPTSTGGSSSSHRQTTTTLQTSSSASGTSTSVDGSEAPTATSAFPTATAAPSANAGFTQDGISSVVLALALTFVRIFGV
ncbi:hypothetical protein BDW74DRAFT_137099 [Aspergillus multicolor]|uniref:uncharacterized protein n=1 Tax=Aspergillus multicolor TaxID=41759 RepID=UPI003CCE34BE